MFNATRLAAVIRLYTARLVAASLEPGASASETALWLGCM
jgi:hypothetical protein